MIWQCRRYWSFRAVEGLFLPYIRHWMAVKEDASRRRDDPTKAIAKRYLNSLYGKFGQAVYRTSLDPYLDDEGVLRFEKVESDDGSSYLPIAMFITAYARRRIISEADALGDAFVYADTDSLHVLTGSPKNVHPTRLGAFKLESVAHRAKYIGPKKYIHEYEYEPGRLPPSKREVKCAGLPEEAKRAVTFENFRTGTEYEGKLAGRQVRGGYLLAETVYRIRVR